MTIRRGVIVAGIDVGNHTTELVLSCVHDGTVTPQAHGHAPTRGRKGSLESLQGAAALLHRVEADTGVHADELVISALRPVDTATAPMPPASTPGAPVRSLRRPDASTAGGTGYGVGRHVPLHALAEAPSDEPVVVSVDSDTDFEAAACALTVADRGGWRIVGIVAAQDDAVLIRNRIPFDVPVVDEVDLTGVAPDVLIAVEVVAEGRAYRATADPIALAAALKLPADRLVQVAEFCRELADSAAIAVTASTGTAAPPDRDEDFADCRVGGELRRYSLAHAHAVLRQAPPGCVEFIRLGKVPTAKNGLAVHDAFFTDLGAVDNGAWLRRGLVEASGTVVALLAADDVDDAAATLAELTGRPARTLATEPEAAAWGARSTPGLPPDTMVCDIGGGTIDLIGSSRSVVAAGAGEAVTVAVAHVLGVPRALAEQVKRSPAVRVEGPHVAHEEDGRRVFLDAPAQSDAIGRLCTRGPAGLVPFSSRLAAEEWRSLRLAIKQETVAANIARALRGFDRPPAALVLAGGGALDDELMRSVSEALRTVRVVVGRANVLGVHGPRFAVACGLVEMYAAGR